VAGGPTLQPTSHYDDKKTTKNDISCGSNVLLKSGGIADDKMISKGDKPHNNQPIEG
jgi:hypothetical protein